MFTFKETCGVIMTPDKKCILRGKSRYGMQLCLVDEKSRLKVRKWSISKGITNFVDTKYIRVSNNAKELYNIAGNKYEPDKMGELIAVKLNVTYSEQE